MVNIAAENFLNLMKNVNLHIEEDEWTIHIREKGVKVKHKRKSWKKQRKNYCYIQRIPGKIKWWLSSEMLEVGKHQVSKMAEWGVPGSGPP